MLWSTCEESFPKPWFPVWNRFVFLLTQVIQVPQGKYKVLPTERTKVSSYPVALIPGQFQEYYKRYSVDVVTTGLRTLGSCLLTPKMLCGVWASYVVSPLGLWWRTPFSQNLDTHWGSLAAVSVLTCSGLVTVRCQSGPWPSSAGITGSLVGKSVRHSFGPSAAICVLTGW